MFSFKVSALQHTEGTSTPAAAVAAVTAGLSRILNVEIIFFNVLLLIISLCSNIIVSAPQAVAFAIPQSDSLMMFQPEEVNNSRMMALNQRRKFPKSSEKLDIVLTPGQQVINALPDNERGDFIIYQLAIALQEAAATEVLQGKLFRNLNETVEYYEAKLKNLKNVPIYEKFPTELLQWIGDEFNLTNRSVYSQLRSRSSLLCNSEGVCYSSQDIGCLCCPF